MFGVRRPGDFKNNGRRYNKKKPPKVLDHDFPLKALGKVTPYGIDDINRNEGVVNLGISKDTCEFAVGSISRWWLTGGGNTYPHESRLYIKCDGGGSNGARNNVFKPQLREFANRSGLEVHVSHFPPGTSTGNKLEHMLFCSISIEAIIELIGSRTTTSGLKVIWVQDENTYEMGIKVSDEDFEKITIKRETTCPDWNYIISSNK